MMHYYFLGTSSYSVSLLLSIMPCISGPEITAWPSESFISAIFRTCKELGNKTFLEDVKSKKAYSYNDVHQMICRVATTLQDFGIGPGKLVSFFGKNSFQTFCFVYGVAMTGGTFSPINPELKEGELSKMLLVSRPSIIYCEQEGYLNVINEAIKISGIKPKIVTASMFEKILVPYEKAKNFQPPVIADNAKHTYLVLFTSGTTGIPKAVKITDQSTILQCKLLQWGGTGRFLLTSPIFWISNSLLIAKALLGYYSIVLPDKLDVESILRIVQDYKITSWFGGPSIFLEICSTLTVEKIRTYDLSSLQTVFIGGSQILLEHRHLVLNSIFNGKNVIRMLYGSTESGVVSEWTHPYDPESPEYASNGKLVTGMKAKVVDINTKKELGPGQEGEIYVQASTFMAGYMNEDLAGKELDENGWWRMGDIGYFDNNGHLYFVSRLKDILKYRGVQLAPSELEEILLKHPGVLEACVVGKPDAIDGDRPAAFIVKKPNAAVSEKELEEFVSARVPNSKRIRAGIHFMASLPKSSVGKYLTTNLVKLLEN